MKELLSQATETLRHYRGIDRDSPHDVVEGHGSFEQMIGRNQETMLKHQRGSNWIKKDPQALR